MKHLRGIVLVGAALLSVMLLAGCSAAAPRAAAGSKDLAPKAEPEEAQPQGEVEIFDLAPIAGLANPPGMKLV